jgi:hypothetical protein
LTLPDEAGLRVMEQLPDSRVQVVSENTSLLVPETFDQEIVPVGLYPFTVTVHITGWPGLRDVESHAIRTLVASLPTVTVRDPRLTRLLESPP